VIETRIERVAPNSPEPGIIREAAQVLRKGGLVAFPTETVYGLGADVLSPEAVQKVFRAKGRPSDNPMIVHISDQGQLFDLVDDEVPVKGEALAAAFWPGPLTLVMKRTILVSDSVTAGLDTVAIRMPNHPVALALINEVGGGIVGPSANLSGRPSPTNASHVLDDLRGRIDLILDAGACEIGVESTVIDVTVEPPVILRLGGLPVSRIEEVIGRVATGARQELLVRSPGTRHRHYAPRARVFLVNEHDVAAFSGLIRTLRQEGKSVGCIIHSKELALVESGKDVRVLPSGTEILARYLYRTLRELDQQGIDVIIVEGVPEEGLGATIMDRIRRASEA